MSPLDPQSPHPGLGRRRLLRPGFRGAPVLLGALILVAELACRAPEETVPEPSPEPGDRAASPLDSSRPQGGEALDSPPLGSDDLWIGVIVPREVVDVAAEDAGRLARVEVEVGDRVRAGQRLASLDTALLREELRMAEADLRLAEAELARARQLADQEQERYERRAAAPDLLSREELEDATLDARVAATGVVEAEARLARERAATERLRQSLARADIRAPFDGTVAVRYRDPGSALSPGQPIVRLVQRARSGGNALQARFAVPPEAAHRAAVGSRVEIWVEGSGGRPVPALAGRVARLAPEIDGPSQHIFAEASLELGQGLGRGPDRDDPAPETPTLTAGQGIWVRPAPGAQRGGP